MLWHVNAGMPHTVRCVCYVFVVNTVVATGQP